MRALVVRLLVVFVALLWAPSAMAQITALTLDRDGEPHKSGFQNHISRADCEANENFEFTMSVTAPSDFNRIELWISEGADCSLPDERGSNGLCNEVSLDALPATTVIMDIDAKDIADAVDGIDECDDTGGDSSSHVTKLYFLLIRDGVGADEPIPAGEFYQFLDTQVDLLGPAPPTLQTVEAIDTGVAITIDGTFNGDAVSYQAYCDPIITGEGAGGGGAGGGSDTAAKPQGPIGGGVVGGGVVGGGVVGGGVVGGAAGTGGAGGTGGASGTAGAGGTATTGGSTGDGGSGGGASSECISTVLVAGEQPPSANACGSPLSGTGSAITVTGAVNDTNYAVGVAGVDDLDNPGALSTLLCATPKETISFFDAYNSAGGQGGCIGGCAVAPSEHTGSAIGLAALAGVLLLRRRRTAAVGRAWLGLFAALAFVLPSFASAQSSIDDNNWRHRHRPEPPPADVDFAFEVRFAPYWPHVDDEPGLTGAPYEATFGNDAQFYFGLEFDYMPIRIPYVGTLGAGVGWGYTWASAPADYLDCPGESKPGDVECESSDETSLDIMPMHASVVLRADELMRRTGVPIVPYGKFGFGWAYWSTSTAAGVSEIAVEGESENLFGQDVTIGLHIALGAALALNWIDARSAGSLRESTGIAHMYLMAEWMNAMLNGFGGGQMYVGTSTFVTGLAADF